MHNIKDLFEKKQTEHAHNKFIRYSKGVFTGPLLSCRISKNNVKLSGSFHFVDEFLDLIVNYVGDEEILIKGSLVWNRDLSPEFEQLGIKYLKVTKSRGIFKYVLENKVKLKSFVDLMGKYNLLISLKTDTISYTCKTSFPKPNKEFSDNFCKVILPIELKDKVFEEFAFDIEDKSVKKFSIKHIIEVKDIVLPEIDDFEKARRLAKRVGTVKRYVTVNDEKEIETIIDFNI